MRPQVRQEQSGTKDRQKGTEYQVFVTVCHSPHVQLLANSSCSTKTRSLHLFLLSFCLDHGISTGGKLKRTEGVHSQVGWVHNGKVWVLAVGGALVWAGGARSGADHQRVLEIPCRALRFPSHQPPAPSNGRSAVSRCCSCAISRLQISVLGNEDVVVPVLPVRAEGGGHLNTQWRSTQQDFVIFSPTLEKARQQKPGLSFKLLKWSCTFKWAAFYFLPFLPPASSTCAALPPFSGEDLSGIIQPEMFKLGMQMRKKESYSLMQQNTLQLFPSLTHSDV